MIDGKLYAVGGHDGPMVKKSAEVFDPETETWKPIADMSLCRRNAGGYTFVALAASRHTYNIKAGTAGLRYLYAYSLKV